VAIIQISAGFGIVGGLSYDGNSPPYAYTTAHIGVEWDPDYSEYTVIQEAIFTNLNDGLGIAVEGPSLVGRWVANQGPAQRIPLSSDFTLDQYGTLNINWGGLTTVNAAITTLQGQVTALQTNEAADAASISTLQSQVATLQASLTSLQNEVEMIRETVRLNPTGSATLAGAGGMIANIGALWQGTASFAGAGSFAVNEIKATFLALPVFSVSSTFMAFTLPTGGFVTAHLAPAGGLTAIGSFAEAAMANFAPVGGFGMPAATQRMAGLPFTFAPVGNMSAPAAQSSMITATFAATGGVFALAGFVQSGAAAFAGVGGFAADSMPYMFDVAEVFAGVGGFAGGDGGTAVLRAASATFAGAGHLAASYSIPSVGGYYSMIGLTGYTAGTSNAGCGLANSSFVINGNNPGDDAAGNSWGLQPSSTGWRATHQGTAIALSTGASASGDAAVIAWDPTNRNIYFGINSNWYDSSGTQQGAISSPPSAAWAMYSYAAAPLFVCGGVGHAGATTVTLNNTPPNIPTGFVTIGSGNVFNPSDKATNLTLSNSNKTITSGAGSGNSVRVDTAF
jgi:hypothetical protein